MRLLTVALSRLGLVSYGVGKRRRGERAAPPQRALSQIAGCRRGEGGKETSGLRDSPRSAGLVCPLGVGGVAGVPARVSTSNLHDPLNRDR